MDFPSPRMEKRHITKGLGTRRAATDAMQEVLERRFREYKAATDEGFARLPDLILLDGGKGQVNAVTPVLRVLGIHVPVYGMVKDNKHRTRAIAYGGGELSMNSR